MTNKYQRRIKTIQAHNGEGEAVSIPVNVDVYDVLTAFDVSCPAMGHAIKKCLAPGQRGVKDSIQDKNEAIASIKRSIEIESPAEDDALIEAVSSDSVGEFLSNAYRDMDEYRSRLISAAEKDARHAAGRGPVDYLRAMYADLKKSKEKEYGAAEWEHSAYLETVEVVEGWAEKIKSSQVQIKARIKSRDEARDEAGRGQQSDLQKQLSQSVADSNKYRLERNAARVGIRKLRQKLNECEANLKTGQNDASQLAVELTKCESELNEARDEVDQWRTGVRPNILQHQLGECEAERDAALTKVGTLEAELAKWKVFEEETRQELLSLRLRLGTRPLSKRDAALNNAKIWAQQADEAKQLREKLTKYESELNDARKLTDEVRESYQRDLDSLRKDYAESDADALQLKQRLARCEAERDALRDSWVHSQMKR